MHACTTIFTCVLAAETRATRKKLMDSVNPSFILRNHVAESAIRAYGSSLHMRGHVLADHAPFLCTGLQRETCQLLSTCWRTSGVLIPPVSSLNATAVCACSVTCAQASLIRHRTPYADRTLSLAPVRVPFFHDPPPSRTGVTCAYRRGAARWACPAAHSPQVGVSIKAWGRVPLLRVHKFRVRLRKLDKNLARQVEVCRVWRTLQTAVSMGEDPRKGDSPKDKTEVYLHNEKFQICHQKAQNS